MFENAQRPLLPPLRWTGRLRRGLVALLGWVSSFALLPAVEVINAGRGGHSSADLLARVERDVVAREPDLVVVLVGSNDMLNPRRFTPLADYRRNLERLIERLRAARADVLLLTAPPCHTPYLFARHDRALFEGKDPNEKLRELNAAIRAVARERRVPLIDLHPVFAASGAGEERKESLLRNRLNSGAADGVHPTAEGYAAIARLVVVAMAEHDLLGRRRIVCFGDSITYGAHMTGAGEATGQTYPGELARQLAARSATGP